MALTKVTGQVIKNTTDVTVGVLTVTNTLAVGGTVSIGGTLTYEDVTNVDAVGLITARNGIVVGSGITLSKDGDVFFTGIATGNGSGLTNLPAANLTGTLPAISGANLTNLDASDLASGTVPTARLGSGTASSSTFLRGDSTFAAVTSTTINSNADNRVITGSDTANTLNGESNVVIDANGRLGIGEASPSTPLHVKHATTNGVAIFESGDADGGIALKDNSTSASVFLLASGNDFYAQTNGAERLRITSSGALGTNSTVRAAAGGLDLQSQGATDLGTLTLGASGGQNGQNRSANTENQYRIMMPTYADPSKMVTQLYGVSGSSGHEINYGGYTGWAYATNIHKFYTAADATTGNGSERFRIGSGGEVSLRRGGISATPSFEIYGSGNAGDATADNLRFHNWGDSDGDYWQIGANATLDANGNNSKPSTSIKGAAIRLNARAGEVSLVTSPSSTSTQYEGLTQNKNGHVTNSHQPCMVFGNAIDVSTPSNNTPLQFSGLEVSKGGMSESNSRSRITVPTTGVYLIHAMLSGSVSTAASTDGVEITLLKNGSVYPNVYNHPISTLGINAGDEFDFQLTQIVSVSANDYLEICFTNINTAVAGVERGHFAVSLLH